MKDFYYLNKPEENCNEFLSWLSKAENPFIYLSSSGGGNYEFMAIREALNEREDAVLIATGDLSSNAFVLFFSFKGKKKLTYEATAFLHYSGSKFRIMANGKMEYNQDKAELKEGKERAKIERKFYEGLLNEKELRKLENGDTLFMGNKRLQELLN